MISFRTIIFQADMNYGGNIISEEAVIKAIDKFQKLPLVLGKTTVEVGSVDKLEYNKETKEVTALITLKAQLNILFNNSNSIIIPEGKRIIETSIKKAIFEL